MEAIMKCSMNEGFLLEVKNEGKFLSFKIVGHTDSPTVYLDKYSVSVLKSLKIDNSPKIDVDVFNSEEQKFRPMGERRLICETNFDFVEWMDGMCYTIMNTPVLGRKLFDDFKDAYPEFRKGGRFDLTLIKFYKWINAYSEFNFGQRPFIRKAAEGKEITFSIHSSKTEVKL